MESNRSERKLRFGLALSGGGYRAAAFHLGTLNKLHQLDILKEVEVLSTISGGAITGCAYCLDGQSDYPAFHERMKAALVEKSVINQVLSSSAILVPVLSILTVIGFVLVLQVKHFVLLSFLLMGVLVWVLLKFQFLLLPVSQEIERAYDKFFYRGLTLPEMPARPIMAVGATNMQTGRPFTFSQSRMGDSYYAAQVPSIAFQTIGFPVARAVAASSCVPYAFTPVGIAQEFFQNREQYKHVSPQLIDGGVYDNQGMQKLTQPKSRYQCNIIVASDAGSGLLLIQSYNNTVALLLHTVDLFMNRIKNVQMAANLFQNVLVRDTPIAYLSLGWKLENCIPGFVHNMAQGNVLPSVLAARQLEQRWIDEPEVYRNQIERHLEQQVGYLAIAARNLTTAEREMACRVRTNLYPLQENQLEALVRHAENLTELQVKLYLP